MRLAAELARRQQPLDLGGEGSGNFGHVGRPGEVGGSGEGGAPAGGDSGGLTPVATYSEGKELPPSTPAPASHVVEVPTAPPLGVTRPEAIKVADLGEAVDLILKGKVVELENVAAVATVLEKLADMAATAEANKEQKPHFDLCNVSVAKTNLFCGDIVKTEEFPTGIPRIKMPQLGGMPRPGSEADSLPRGRGGAVDAVPAFLKHLKDEANIEVEDDEVPAASLKATQMDMDGQNVVQMMQADPALGWTPADEPIFVSSDGYVLDGHHRWAAVVGQDAKDGRLGESTMKVRRVDATITELLRRAKDWTTEYGILPKDVPKGKTALSMIFNGDIIVLPYREKMLRLAYGWDAEVVQLGGEGSGNFGHAGRPGEQGGSAKEDEHGRYTIGQTVRFDGKSADGLVEGSMDVKVVDPHSNRDKVTHTEKKGKRVREYEGGNVHLPTATVENVRGKRFEVHHHTIKGKA